MVISIYIDLNLKFCINKVTMLFSDGPHSMQIIDQLSRQINLPRQPERIISLCPSETETLAAIVAPARIVGCTCYCKYPADLVASLPILAEQNSLIWKARCSGLFGRVRNQITGFAISLAITCHIR